MYSTREASNLKKFSKEKFRLAKKFQSKGVVTQNVEEVRFYRITLKSGQLCSGLADATLRQWLHVIQ